MEEILRLFPNALRKAMRSYLTCKWDNLEEIRLRLHQPIEFIFHHRHVCLPKYKLNELDSQFVINQLSDHSLYRLEDELREGYITIKGGHRVGIAGEVNTYQGKINQLQYITFFNIRIAREKQDIAGKLIENLYHSQRFLNTLIIGPPQTGKTTLLRDLARLMSDGSLISETYKVGIIDERSEIAASVNGVPQHNVGQRTDVMDACPKIDGMMMMIRSMSPEIIIVDEIGKKEDVTALLEAINAGVTIICTVHGQSIKELKQRPSTHFLFKHNFFSRFILLTKTNYHKFSMELYNEQERLMQHTWL